LLRRRPALIRIQPIVVLDEVDKFTAADNGLAELERLVSSLKNVLTTRGVHFVVVAGVDLHDQVVRDAYRGNSVYESVFGWQLYVPCLWESPDDLTDGVVLEAHDYPVELDDLVGYLGFKARGVPRRLLQEFNGFVQWVDGSPVLELDDHDSDRIRFYARIDELIREFLHRPGDAVLFPVPLDEDRWRLSTYYAVDRVLRTEGKTFTINEILRIEGELEFDPVLRVSTALANRLLTYLTEHSLIEVVQRADDASAVHVGDVKEAQFTVYRLVDDVKRALFGFALESESERATFGEPVLTSPDVTADVPAIEILADRYVLRDVIGRGGFGTVYGGLDMLLGQPVAVKILGSTMTDDPTARARFLREGRIAAKLVHANIVRTHDLLELDDGRIAIVMELVSGETLRELVRPDGIPGDKAIEVALDLLSALAECDRQKIARIDLKPSNIIIADARTVIVDLGLARAHGADLEVTKEGVLIGTPLYMAPEQANGERADIRADLYAVALVLYECLAGRPARREGSQMEVIMEIINKDLDVGDLPASPELKAVIARAAARNPKDRYSTPEQMSQALQATPEYARSEPS
jgi:serine/threonine-protein kinase